MLPVCCCQAISINIGLEHRPILLPVKPTLVILVQEPGAYALFAKLHIVLFKCHQHMSQDLFPVQSLERWVVLLNHIINGDSRVSIIQVDAATNDQQKLIPNKARVDQETAHLLEPLLLQIRIDVVGPL